MPELVLLLWTIGDLANFVDDVWSVMTAAGRACRPDALPRTRTPFPMNRRAGCPAGDCARRPVYKQMRRSSSKW